ncbi:putative PPM-type phosphatase, divalent cation binding, PPM-type phosphatase domain superfamily [Helianthus annuus]|nr:putative PPM-type phosphatase, divalent cation binding, PPM-type phosphatase domain superfamily [Helianthus annuus]
MGCVCCKCSRKAPSSWSDGGKKIKGKKDRNAAADELLEVVPIPSHNFKLECAVLTRRGYYPDTPNKENQDCFCIKTSVQGNPNVHFFGVFDGHGHAGKQCSEFVQNRLVELLCNDDTLVEFLSSQAVVDMVDRYMDPRSACAAVAAESYKLWLEHENRTDDITIIVVHVNGLLNQSGVTNGDEEGGSSGVEPTDVTPPRSERFRSVGSNFSQALHFHQALLTNDKKPRLEPPR